MKTFYLIIDESGAKGYSTNKEKLPKEFGVMAGFLVPSDYIKNWRDNTSIHFNMETDRKTHITSLNKINQNKFRETLYNIF